MFLRLRRFRFVLLLGTTIGLTGWAPTALATGELGDPPEPAGVLFSLSDIDLVPIDHQHDGTSVFPREQEGGDDDADTPIIRQVAKKKLKQPELEPSAEQQPPTTLPTTMTELSTAFSASPSVLLAGLSDDRQRLANRIGASAVLGIESTVLATTDTGNLLAKSNAALGVSSERRTPIVTFNMARGKQIGQQAGSGSYWFPARQDLDTLLSKLDSRIIEDVVVIQGPYSALYGPYFAFYDVKLLDAPRYPNGPENHGSTSLDWKSNGDQWYGRQTFWGGGENYGFRVGYGERAGSDYRTGDSLEMPTSYHSRDWDVALGWDMGCGKSLDFHCVRLDQTDVEFPGQFFDMDFLVTDACELEYVDECNSICDRLEAEGWYNRTRFEGSNGRPGKLRQLPILAQVPVVIPLPAPVPLPPIETTGRFGGFTDVDAMSTGYKFAATWGNADCCSLTLGTDLRFLKQSLNEDVSIVDVLGFPGLVIPTPDDGIPPSQSANPGLFAEMTMPVNACTTIKTGGRLDFVAMHADNFTLDTDLDGQPNDLEQVLLGGLDQNFTFGSGYVTAERKMGCHWTTQAGVGYAQRPPTMTEMFAVNPFVAIYPQFVFTSIIGNPNLDPEELLQADLGLSAEFRRLRFGGRAYYARVHDYITYDRSGISYNAVNTPLATLAGGEAYGEYDVNCRWAAFATASYVEATDRTRDETVGPQRGVNPAFPAGSRSGFNTPVESLGAIPPLVSRMGLRWHDPCPNQRWAIEFSARIVNDQDKFATTLLERTTPGYTIYDIRGFWQRTDNFLVVAGVENVGDRFYQEHLDVHAIAGQVVGTFQPGTTFYTGWQYTY